MGQKVPFAIKEKVINAWLEGKPRNIIADETDISYGSVTNIITEVKKESIKDMTYSEQLQFYCKETVLV